MKSRKKKLIGWLPKNWSLEIIKDYYGSEAILPVSPSRYGYLFHRPIRTQRGTNWDEEVRVCITIEELPTKNRP